MKKNNTIKLLGVLGVLVVIYLVVTFTGGESRSKSFRSVLVDLDTASVSRIEISSPQDEAIVEKTGAGAWKVQVDGGEKRAVTAVIQNLMATLEGAKPSRLVARSTDSWKDYSVDSTGTRVAVFEGENKKLDLVIGRFGVEGQRNFHTYVRLFEEEDVYLAENFMGISLPKTPDDFRNGDVLRLKRDSLTQISFNYPDSAFTMYKSGDRWTSSDVTIDSAKAEGFVRSLSFVTSKEFVEGINLGNPALNVTFSFSDKPETQISAYLASDGYTVQSSENTDELFAGGDIMDKVFKGPSHFLSE